MTNKVTLHRMTWKEFCKHNSAAISPRMDPDTIIPETYWFEQDGCWYKVDRGSVGWNIYDEGWHNVGFTETLTELRKYGM